MMGPTPGGGGGGGGGASAPSGDALNEMIDDRVAALLVFAGLATGTYDDAGNLL